MHIYRISKCTYIEDLSGFGASLAGGRWNNKGTFIVYAGGSISLTLLEAVVHMNIIPSTAFCRITIEIPDNSIEELDIDTLPTDWNSHPMPFTIKSIGDDFVRSMRAIALKVPSAIVPQEYNYLLNPQHPDFKKRVRIIDRVDQPIDIRLVDITQR